jgi:hypothetical protein
MQETSTSLQNLHPIVMPEPVPLWPWATGWSVLLGFVLIAMAVFAWHSWRAWQANAYRRQALRELHGAGSAEHIPGLLKRTALAVFPRDQVAGVSGTGWHRFLDESAGMSRFCAGAGALMDRLSYGGQTLSETEVEQLTDSARTWLRLHRAG